MKKNVLIFGHSYATQFIDINNQYTNLFDKNKYHVTVAYLTGKPDDQIKQRHVSDEVLFLNFPKRAVRGLKISAIKKLLQLCRAKQFTFVISHRYKPSYVMLWVSLFHHTPIMIDVMHDLATLKSYPRRLLLSLLARKKDIFLAGVSNAVRDDMRKDMPSMRDRIITLYNMIDLDLTEPYLQPRELGREQFKLLNQAFVFGTIGRLAPVKDQHTLIHAFSLIQKQCPNAFLVIMGDGELEATLKKEVAKLQLNPYVIFTGFVPEAFRWLKMFDVFLLTSIREAFGRVLLEAMVARLPIIAAKTNGIPEVVGDCGVIVPPKNKEQLAKEMLDFYKMPQEQRLELGNKAYQRAVKNFSQERFNEIFWQLPLVKERGLA